LRVFIGDIQGCLHELDALLDRLAFDPALHQIYCVGDLVNRGPDSLGVLRRLREIGADSVLGNHDLHCLAIHSGHRRRRKGDSLKKLLRAHDVDELMAWLRTRPLVMEWDDVILVHAGLHPRWNNLHKVARSLEERIQKDEIPFHSNKLAFLTRARHCNAKGKRPRPNAKDLSGFRPWDEFYEGAKTVVCGHWAMRGLVVKDRLRSLDSGCVWGGSLSAWICEEDRVISVPAEAAHRKIPSST